MGTIEERADTSRAWRRWREKRARGSRRRSLPKSPSSPALSSLRILKTRTDYVVKTSQWKARSRRRS